MAKAARRHIRTARTSMRNKVNANRTPANENNSGGIDSAITAIVDKHLSNSSSPNPRAEAHKDAKSALGSLFDERTFNQIYDSIAGHYK